MGDDDHDLDQPVELIFRGDRIDVLGFVTAMHLVFNDKSSTIQDVMNERGGHVAQELVDEIKTVDNFGQYEKELKRAHRADAVPEFRGAAVEYREFDPQHPEPTGAKLELLPDLEDTDQYFIMTFQEEEGFQAAGWPEYFDDVVHMMAWASFLRQFARDLENASDPDFDDMEAAMEEMDGD